MNNLLEFVLGGNPSQPEQGIKPLAQYKKEGTSSVLEYSYACTAAAEEAYRSYAESSTDHLQWTALENGVDGVILTEQSMAGGKRIKAKLTVAERKLYLRLRVEAQ